MTHPISSDDRVVPYTSNLLVDNDVTTAPLPFFLFCLAYSISIYHMRCQYMIWSDLTFRNAVILENLHQEHALSQYATINQSDS
jgi:hypothetical protein